MAVLQFWGFLAYKKHIFEMLYDGKSQYAIAELIGKPQTTVNYMVKRMRTILQRHIGREDLGI